MKDSSGKGLAIGAGSLNKAKVETAAGKMSAAIEKAASKRLRERQRIERATAASLKIVGDAMERLISREEGVRQAFDALRSPLAFGDIGFETDVRPNGSDTLFNQHLSSRIHIATPPYDHTWAWGDIHKNGVSASAGNIGVIGFSHETKACAAGLTLFLTTDRAAQVSVRPFIRNNWQYSLRTAGFWSWAEARGGIDASAWVDGGMIAGVRRTTAFDRRTSSLTADERGEEVVLASDLELSFSMVPGKIYGVSFGAWLEMDSWGGVGGKAGAHAMSQGKVQFVVIERFA